ncbi:MAG: type I 3-dehydroquinate dehydratase [Archaeoglobus sp.]|nr:type I 3-dehydroquinate dehydratase [Archaeoglobus sp.]
MKIVCTLVSENLDEALLCDAIELRLDILNRRTVNKVIETAENDLIFTCRRRSEGGRYEGEERKRLELISRYVMYADYLDLEHDVADEFFKAASHSGARIIESYHGVNPGYGYLKDLVEGKRGDIVKMAIFTEEKDGKENLRTILKLHAEYENLIAFLIGESHSYTRIISSLIGHPFLYCYSAVKAAPGQYSVKEAIQIKKMLGWSKV